MSVYVCVCMAITDRQICEAAQGGARNLKDLRRDLGVARECGHCAAYARQCLEEAKQDQKKRDKTKRLVTVNLF
ncbi:(2Fe-2S)-binding protein [Propionivibrio sp.]|uniref:(2Fe-2S)-binding protein n=1 Tax=Propionivibrio sp. TaxID=2212460 RepID=UPI003BF2D61D